MNISAPLYYIKNLTVSFGKYEALHIGELSFTQGGIHRISGPNGSGKTTLMKSLNALVKIKPGTIYYKNSDIAYNQHLVRSETVYLHQSPYPFSTTVYNNIRYGLKIRKFSDELIEQRIDEALDLLNIKHLSGKMATGLSSGELQKVAIARCIVLQPEVLFLDEPVASVDVASVPLIEEVIKYLAYQQKKTVFYTSHQSLSTDRFYDTITILECGKIIKG